jgi:hypothetical protein
MVANSMAHNNARPHAQQSIRDCDVTVTITVIGSTADVRFFQLSAFEGPCHEAADLMSAGEIFLKMSFHISGPLITTVVTSLSWQESAVIEIG